VGVLVPHYAEPVAGSVGAAAQDPPFRKVAAGPSSAQQTVPVTQLAVYEAALAVGVCGASCKLAGGGESGSSELIKSTSLHQVCWLIAWRRPSGRGRTRAPAVPRRRSRLNGREDVRGDVAIPANL
jgi:hypothetical protein